MSANLLSMGAVDFGIIVDGGVVIIESIVHRLSERRPAAAVDADCATRIERRRRPRSCGRRCSRCSSSSPPTCRSSCSQRVEGRIFAPMANTVVAALVGALLFSVTLVPVLATLRYPQADPPPRLAGAAPARRRRTSRRCAGRCATASWCWSAACWRSRAAVVALSRLGSEFLPELNEGSLYLTFTLPSNISLDEGRRWCRASPRSSSSYPEVDVDAVAARPARGRHRPDADQQPRVLRAPEAAGALAGGRRHARRRDRAARHGARARSPASRSTSRSRSATT